MTEIPRPLYEVLLLCTAYSARSLMAEAIVNHRHGALFRAHSAGSYPKDTAHPLALHVLEHRGLPTEELGPKPWDAFADAFGQLANRLLIPASPPMASLDRRSLKRRLDEIDGTASAPAG